MIASAVLLAVMLICTDQASEISVHLEKGKSCLANRRYEEAAAEFREVLAHDPINTRALFNLWDIYGNRLKKPGLRDEYWNRYKAASIAAKGDVALLEGNLADAEARYREAMSLVPEDSTLHEKMGMLYLKSGREAEAIQECRTASSLNPDNVRLQMRLARYLLGRGEKEEALSLAERAVSARPMDTKLQREVFAMYAEAGEKARLLEPLAALSKSGGASPEEHCVLAEAFMSAGRLDEAAAELRQGYGTHTAARCAALAGKLAEAYERRGAEASAAAVYRAMLAANIASPEIYNSLIVIYQQMGKLDAAAAAGEKGIAAFPGSAVLHNNLATVYALRANYERAVSEYQKAVGIAPGLAEAYLDMGIVYGSYLKQDDRAREAFRRYVELKPEGKTRPEVAEMLGATCLPGGHSPPGPDREKKQ